MAAVVIIPAFDVLEDGDARGAATQEDGSVQRSQSSIEHNG
jgi:hypothetical protein